MAKKIRFPLKMKNGAEVRSIDELKENFDLESVLGYFTDGRLATWLTDRYYDTKAEAVSALSADMPDLNAKLCEILEVEYQAENDETDVELIARRREKLQIINGVTDNREILDNIDLVAMNQDELFDILDESPEKVYLYGEKFSIPLGKKNISYIGVNKPLVVLEKDKIVGDYNSAEIIFDNVRFEEGVDIQFNKVKFEDREEYAFFAQEAFDKVLIVLKENSIITDIECRTWITRLKPIMFSEKLTVFSVVTDFERNLILNKYIGAISLGYQKVFGFSPIIEVEVEKAAE